MPVQPSRLLPLAAAALVLAACSDQVTTLSPVSPSNPESPAPLVSVTCTASKASLSVRCGNPGAPGNVSSVIIGGQHTNVELASTNVAIVADTFAFDVAITNLIPQPIGTTNGTSSDPEGVRIFFANGPTSTGAGTVTVANPDGTGTFTAAGQSYYQYTGILAQDETSPLKRWKLRMSPEVTNFTFTVLVSAAVQYPEGYIDDHYYVLTLNPNETRTLPGTVRNVVGLAQPGETISWANSAPSVVSVTGNQATAGAARGFADLTGSSGSRPAVYITSVSVCQAQVVTNGTSQPSSIAASDCYSSYGDNNGTPTTSYFADLYRVTLTAGQTVEVTMDSGDDLDTYLLLAGPTFGELVAGNDDDDDGILGVGSRMIYTATVSGVYVIEASTFNGADTGAYTLGVTITG